MIRKIFFLTLVLITCFLTARSQSIKVSGRLCVPEQGCGGDSTRFEVTGASNISTYNWTFGDTQANTSNRALARHLYLQPGQYNIRVSLTFTGGAAPVSKDTTITIGDLPPAFEFFGGKEDTTICPGTKLLLDPYDSRFFKGTVPTDVTYLWYPSGDTTRTIEVDSMGCYSVEVKNKNGCTVTDRINVKICGESEQQASKWYFGSNAGISFEGGQPTAITDGKINTPEGTSSISDRKGNLLFYTDGRTIYDRDGNVMKSRDPAQDTVKLGGSPGSTQAALIVPQPSCRGCETIYYVFTTKDVNDSLKCLEYTTVDMRGNKGKGIVLEKNVLLQCGVTERLTSIQNPIDSSYWVLTHAYGTNQFILKRLTKNGLEDANSPSIGLPHDTKYRGEGQIKFATSGGKMGVVVPGPDRNYVEVYDFNDTTGTITNKITIDLGPAPPSAYGVEFSPDGTKMYVTLKGTKDSSSVLLQYDLTSKDSATVAASKLEVARSEQIFGALQYAPDGKIYMAIEGSGSLGVISQPDGTTLKDIDFQENGFDLGGKTSQLGLPNFVQSIIQPPTGPGISVADTCFGVPTQFQSGPICDPLKDKYEWDFGDGATSKDQSPTHLYAAPGLYTVKLRQYNQCKDTTMTYQLTIKPQPVADLGPDINACANSVELDSKSQYPNSQYIWLRNGRILNVPTTASKIRVDSTGLYIVVVAIGECYDMDTIQVILERPPLYKLKQDSTFCAGNSLRLDAGPGGSAYLWSTGATTQQITVNQTGNYVVTVTLPRTNNISCQVSDTVKVNVLPLPQISLNPPRNICANAQPVRLPASPTNGKWSGPGVDSTGLFTPKLQLIGAQTLSYAVKGANGCSNSASTVITVDSYPNFTLGPDMAYCADSLRILSGPAIPGATYFWSTGERTQSIQPKSSGTYRLIVGAGNCNNADTVAIKVLPMPNLTLPTKATVCVADNRTVALDAGGNPTFQYRWNPGGETTRIINVGKVGVYTVEVTNADGCAEDHSIEVVDMCEPQIYVPDAFSPNGDGTNDRLKVTTAHVADRDYEFRIYDRWGELIFRTNDKNEEWDGTYKGRSFPPSTYAWVVVYRSLYYPERGISTQRGAVLIAK